MPLGIKPTTSMNALRSGQDGKRCAVDLENLMMSSVIESNLGSGYQRDYEPGRTDERWHRWSSLALGIVLFYVIFQPPFIFAPL
jgi:hypothetical protein